MTPQPPLTSFVKHTVPTRRYLTSNLLLATALILLMIAVTPTMYAIMTPPSFYYYNIPFQVCDQFNPADLHTCPPASHPLKPGDIIPVLVSRCASEPFASPDQLLAYTFTRDMVRADDGARIVLAPLSSTIRLSGCETDVSISNLVPNMNIPSGRYYLEGVATVFGRFKTSASYFKTQTFEIIGDK